MSLVPSNIVKDSSKSVVLDMRTSTMENNRLLQSTGTAIGKESFVGNNKFNQDLNWKVISPTDHNNNDKIHEANYAWNIKRWKSWARGNWISSQPNNKIQNQPPGDYTYQTTFDFPTIANRNCNHNSSNNNSCTSSSSDGSDSPTQRVCEMSMSFQYAADDYVTSISLNSQIVYECSHTTTSSSSTTNNLVSDKAALSDNGQDHISTNRMELVSLQHSSPQSKLQKNNPCRDEYKRLQKKIIHGLIYQSTNTLEFFVHNKALLKSKKNQQQQKQRNNGSGITANGNSIYITNSNSYNNGDVNPTGFLFKFDSITLGNCSAVKSTPSSNSYDDQVSINNSNSVNYIFLKASTTTTVATIIVTIVVLIVFLVGCQRKRMTTAATTESKNPSIENTVDTITSSLQEGSIINGKTVSKELEQTREVHDDNNTVITEIVAKEENAPTIITTKITATSIPKMPLTPTHIPKSILIHHNVPILPATNNNTDKTSTISSIATNNNQTILTASDDVYHSVSPNTSNLKIQVHSEGTAVDDDISDIVSVYSTSNSTTPSHNNNRSSNQNSFNDNSYNNSYSSIHNATTTTSTTRSQPSSLKKQKHSPRISGNSGSGTSRSNVTASSLPNSARKQLPYAEEFIHKPQLQHNGDITTTPNNNTSGFDTCRSSGSHGSSSNHCSHKKITYNIYTGHSEIVDINTDANSIVTMPITPNKKTISSFCTPQSSTPIPPLSPIIATLHTPVTKSATAIPLTTPTIIDKKDSSSSSSSSSSATNTKLRDYSKYFNDTSTSQTPTSTFTTAHSTHGHSSARSTNTKPTAAALRRQQQQSSYTTPRNTTTTASATSATSVTHNTPASARETWKTVQKDLIKHQENQSSGWKDISAEDMIRL